MLCCAYLRVYQPADTFQPVERERPAPSRAAEFGAGTTSIGFIAADERRDVYEKVVDGVRYVCPAQNRLRTLLGLLAFERSQPDGIVHVFFSPEEIDDARRELEEIQSRFPSLRPSLLQSPWHVPLRWFVCFDDSERRIERDDDQLRVRYETTMAKAVERARRALETLKGGIVHPVVVGMVYELNEWLSTFDERSIIELDYASVASLFDEDDLADDHSAADVWNAIYALADGDGMRAGLYYQRANDRWTRARSRESTN